MKMKLFTALDIKNLDKYTIEEQNITSTELMERASSAMFDCIINDDYLCSNSSILVFAGAGNNGGDALVIARKLLEKQFDVTIALIYSTNHSKDFQINLTLLQSIYKAKIFIIQNTDDLQKLSGDIVIDGIFGSGLNRAIEGIFIDIVSYINKLKNNGSYVISIDVPSGLFCEDNSKNNVTNIVHPNIVLSLQFPKIAFLLPDSQDIIDEWKIVDIALSKSGMEKTQTEYYFVDDAFVKELIPKRKRFSHKGTYGNAILFAGSSAMTGASVLSAKACMKTGCGLLTVHAPNPVCSVIRNAIPEAIISCDGNEKNISELPAIDKYNAVAFGPGIGQSECATEVLKMLIEEIKKTEAKLVIDADGLNILSKNKELLYKLPPQSILTPHPKEFERLSGKSNSSWERLEKQKEFSKKYNVIVVLKGAYTCITTPSGKCYFNSSGNPGLATAGSGDVLTGMILSLCAQGFSALDAALCGVYLHGLAGDIYVQNESEYSLIASDVIDNIGKAFHKICFKK